MKSGEIEKKEIIVGIDLGTTNSLIAFTKNGNTELVKDKYGKNTLVPSIIHFSEDNNLIVGDEAKSKLLLFPERTIYSVKRLLGKSYSDLINHGHSLAYEIIDEEDQLVKIKVGSKFFSPIELSAEILKYLKNRIEGEMNVIASKAVITVPAYFNDSQRQATRDAGKLAGLEVLRIVNEPTAASLAYGIGHKNEDEEKIAVYDLGGGTFDISILNIHDGIFDVLSTNGDTFLGGDDIDQLIIKHWVEKNPGLEALIQSDKSVAQSLRLKAEDAKKQLSTSDNFEAEELGISLSRNNFEKLIRPVVQKTLSKCRQAIQDSGLAINEIDRLIFVGGSTRIPFIKKSVSDYFNCKVSDHINPDEVVAIGAAVQADILAGNQDDMLLLDVTPLSLGIETVGGLMDVIIPRNSKVPLAAGRSYTTSVDGQKNLKVAIFQGERDLVEDNRKLGEFILKDIPPMPAGIPKIKVHFIIDADGILRVKALEERSGKETEIEIKSQYGISESEMGKMLLDSLKNAETDMKIKALKEAINEAESLILSAGKFIDQNKDILDSGEIETLNEMIKNLKSSIQTEDKDQINLDMKTLNEYSAPLAQKAMDKVLAEALKGKKV